MQPSPFSKWLILLERRLREHAPFVFVTPCFYISLRKPLYLGMLFAVSALDDIAKANSLISRGKRPKPTGPAGPYRKGQSGNPSGRPRVPREVVEACRCYSPRAVECLQEIVERFFARDYTVRAGDARGAAEALLDRAWGKAPETVRLEAADADDTLALNPSTLDLDALAHLAALVRHLPPGPTLERVTPEPAGRASAALPADDSAGVPQEGPAGADPR